MPRYALGCALALFAAACSGSALEGLEGRWSGDIICPAFNSRLTLGLQVLGQTLTGDAQTRTKEITADWKISGTQETLQRAGTCPDDSCVTDADCASKGGGTCNSLGICRPCSVQESYRQVTMSFADVDVQSPDPTLVVERQGDTLLTGTIKGFCPDEDLATPEVRIEKDP